MGLGLGRYWFKLIKRETYSKIPISTLLTNWLFQRVFRQNAGIPFSVHYTSKVSGPAYLNIHPSVYSSFAVSGGAHICGFKGGAITIEEDTIFAFNVCIQGANHDLKNRKHMLPQDVHIGRNCWLGNSVTILPGVHLGENVIVGANSVVTKSFGPNVLIAGIPAKIIKEI